ncbi:phage tail protein [Kerstersia gyiorum]|uniref:phage tail protein n=1 Tax=Kerstersia gyiorum TaxID=206506 RepID=UPI0010713803|nr:phage tail protein [Kerstersia gyiorum]QBR40949.1 phage tail protein [Kerstersia gyiorum]
MTYEEFTWCPHIDAQATESFSVLSAQFGDGYKQAVGEGINNGSQSWQLQFVGREAEIRPIRDFLRRHKGFMPFRWAPPLDGMGLFEVTEFSVIAKGGNLYEMSATFAQRFAP